MGVPVGRAVNRLYSASRNVDAIALLIKEDRLCFIDDIGATVLQCGSTFNDPQLKA